MASKQLAPLNLPNLVGPPSVAPGAGFLKVYMKTGWFFKTNENGITKDLVLDRPLTGFALSATVRPITRFDTILSSLEHLQKSVSSLELVGDITGNAEYIDDKLVLHSKIEALDFIPTEDQKLAMEYATTPGAANPFLTALDLPQVLIDVIDYDYNIAGVKDDTNQVFYLSKPYVAGSLAVYLNGQKLTPGNFYDFREGTDNILLMMRSPEAADLLLATYKTVPQ
jgi:hypothetical protein